MASTRMTRPLPERLSAHQSRHETAVSLTGGAPSFVVGGRFGGGRSLRLTALSFCLSWLLSIEAFAAGVPSPALPARADSMALRQAALPSPTPRSLPAKSPLQDTGNEDTVLRDALRQPPGPLAKLATMALEADALALQARHGEPDIGAVRQRLAKLEAIDGEANQSLHVGPARHRVLSRLIAAWAHARLADAVQSLPTPAAANSREARAAWETQRANTIRDSRLRAAAYLRSCLTLAHAWPKARKTCAHQLTALPDVDGPGSFSSRLPSDPRALVLLRSAELGPCISQAATRTRDLLPPRVMARLELDASGLVQTAHLEGELGSEALKACLERALRLWAFPSLGDAVLELPIQLRVTTD